MFRRMVEALAARPRVFDALRWTLEGGYAGHWRVIEQELSTVSGPILDIGCGTGLFAGRFDPADYLGIDISPAYIRAASRKHPRHQFAVMDARQLTITDRTYQRCFISGLLHHLSDDAVSQVLCEAARVLQPQGRLVVWEDIPTRSWWNVVGPPIHALDLGSCIRTPDGYRRLIESKFVAQSEFLMRSGCLDYVVFRCLPRPTD